MEFEMGYISALIIIGLSFLGFFLALIIDEINKKKGILIFILSLVLLGLGVYYYYVVGQWQNYKGGYSPNKLNYYLNIYRQKPESSPIPF
ncbi:MAG TPA: hypothetical protein PKN36_01765 [bacterium]|nr:hypothetical protein [bacterium]